MLDESKMMGCTFRVHSSKEIFTIEFAVTLLATLECILGTGFHNNLLSRASLFEIEIIKCSQDGFSMEVEYNRETPTHLTIVISEYKDSEFQSAHKLLSSKLIEAVSIIISTILISNEDVSVKQGTKINFYGSSNLRERFPEAVYRYQLYFSY